MTDENQQSIVEDDDVNQKSDESIDESTDDSQVDDNTTLSLLSKALARAELENSDLTKELTALKEKAKKAKVKGNALTPLLTIALDEVYQVFSFDGLNTQSIMSTDPNLQSLVHVSQREKRKQLGGGANYWSGLQVCESSRSRPGLRLFPGVTVVLGKAGTGKTRFATKYLFPLLCANPAVRYKNVRYFSIKETDGPIIKAKSIEKKVFSATEGRSFTMDRTERGFVLRLVRFIADTIKFSESKKTKSHPKGVYQPAVAIVDSFRYLFYSSRGGSFGRGGVNTKLFLALTDLDILAQDLRMHFVITINPMVNTDDMYESYREQLVGTVSNIIELTKDENVVIQSSRFTGRAPVEYSVGSKSERKVATKSSKTDSFIVDPADFL